MHRVLGWVDHLPSFGWDVGVVTLPIGYWPAHLSDRSLLERIPDDTRIERVAPRLMSSLPKGSAGYAANRPAAGPGARAAWAVARGVKTAVLFPDTRILWAGPAAARVEEIARADPVDVILSTSPENSSHIAGQRAASRIGAAWVADVRDPWRSVWTKPPTALHDRLLERMGRRLLARADAVTAVSPSLAAHLRTRYGVPEGKVAVVMHGIDDGLLDAPDEPAETPGFTIVHTGALYGRRHIEAFLGAVRRLSRRRADEPIRVLLLGPIDAAAAVVVDGFRNEAWLEVRDAVPHRDALRLQRAADALLLIPGEGSLTLPGKIFEYLGARRPIVALCAPDSDSARLVQELGAGVVVSQTDGAAIESAVERLLTERPARRSAESLRSFARSAMVERMSQVLDRVARGDHA